jgi:choline-sulfatase
MLITGRSLWDAQAIYKTTDAERVAGRLWPQLLASAGYKTFFTGKWHIQASADAAFTVAKNIRPGMPRDTPEGYNRPLLGQPDPWSPSDPKFGGFWQGGKHWSEVGADDAVEFLQASKDATQPFFMYVAFNAPHDPRQSPQSYVDKYPLSRIAVPRNFLPEYPHKEDIGSGRNLRDEKLAPFPRTEHAVKVNRQEYYALISHLDTQIGRVLAALDASGKAGNTWIFLTADHGLAVGQHGLFGKQNMYEHSLRVPFVVVGPGVAANRKISNPIYLQDVMPTTLEIAGVTKPAHVHFHSLLPQISGKVRTSSYPAIYGAYLELQRAVIHDGYKMILYPKTGVTRLYHLSRDPEEMTDLANRPEHAARKRELLQQLTRLQKQLGDTLELGPAFTAQ